MAAKLYTNMFKKIFFVIFITTNRLSLIVCDEHKFPENFQFGLATASYQVEGAWNLNGKGENIWDHLTHKTPDHIKDKSNGDVACDAYHKTKDDVRLLREMKVDFYRFSLSWSRLLPRGFSYKVNEDGVRYYNELIDELLRNNIKPMVTLYHWDLPQKLQELGGWSNPLIVEWFGDYANTTFGLFGDRVKDWITVNEPSQICQQGYADGTMAPAYKSAEMGSYLCAHHLILSHAKAYRLYEREYKDSQKGRVGFTMDSFWYEPLTQEPEDIEAAKRALIMNTDWYGHPIFSKSGDYPEMLKERVSKLSEEEGFQRSRLPEFTEEEIQTVRGSYDFFGFNHYTTKLVKDGTDDDHIPRPSHEYDTGVSYHTDPEWERSGTKELYIVPEGIRKCLQWIHKEYDGPEIVITENGYSDPNTDDLKDCRRIKYYNSYLDEVLKAIHEDGVRVTGYTAWSFMDNFEWTDGYTTRFGLYYVNYTDPNRQRTPKMSAFNYKNIVQTKKIDWNFSPEHFDACEW